MWNWILIGIMWVAAFVCWKVMKKIQPENSKLYLAYALSICILITWFAIVYLSQA